MKKYENIVVFNNERSDVQNEQHIQYYVPRYKRIIRHQENVLSCLQIIPIAKQEDIINIIQLHIDKHIGTLIGELIAQFVGKLYIISSNRYITTIGHRMYNT